MNDWLALAICLAYILGIIIVAESLRRWRGYGIHFTRNVIHIGVGMLIWAVPILFPQPDLFIVGCLAFAVFDLLDWRFGFLASMASASEANLGTIYFPLAAAAITYLLWDQPPLMVAALMPLTWGDGLAPVFGTRYGRHTYTVRGNQRSLEGSAVFFVAAAISTWLALWLVPGTPQISLLAAVLPAFMVAVLTTAVEAVSPWGLDNLTVSAVAFIVLTQWPF